MAERDIIVIGASAGGVEALKKLVHGLPADLPAALFVTIHIPAFATSALPAILTRSGPLPASHPRDGEPIRRGRIYVAPPDHHLLVEDGCVRLTRGPRENSARPAIDPMFRTAARAYGPRVVGVLLTGMLDDGTMGAIEIDREGGVVVVQDPDDAPYPGIPRSALENDDVDHVLPLAEIAGCLATLAGAPARDADPNGRRADVPDIAEVTMHPERIPDPRRPASGFVCPGCGGALWEDGENGFLRLRCRVGHAYSENALLAEHDEALEVALWTALRTLEERAALSRRMSGRMEERGHSAAAERFRRQADDAERRAAVIANVLSSGGAARVPTEAAPSEAAAPGWRGG